MFDLQVLRTYRCPEASTLHSYFTELQQQHGPGLTKYSCQAWETRKPVRECASRAIYNLDLGIGTCTIFFSKAFSVSSLRGRYRELIAGSTLTTYLSKETHTTVHGYIRLTLLECPLSCASE